MSNSITILQGQYRDDNQRVQVLSNHNTTTLKPISQTLAKGYVLVSGQGLSKIRSEVRVKTQPDQVISEQHTTAEPSEPAETAEQAMDRIRARFQILDQMTDALAQGQVRGVIISGPPGVGKSHGVETILSQYDAAHKLSGRNALTEVVRGSMSPIGLYKTLYANSEPGSVLVLDDCDSLLFDELCLNMLKAVLDTGERRRVCWRAESRVLKQEGIPDSFDFRGGICFITNLDFANTRSQKLADHLAALQSRCHYIDLEMNSDSDRFLRIRQIMADGLLKDYGFGAAGDAEILQFMLDNQKRLREISLRQVIKIADLRQITESGWPELASATCLRRG